MSFLSLRRPKTEDGSRPTSLGSSALSRVFTKPKLSSAAKKGRIVSDSGSRGEPVGWSASDIEQRRSTSSGSSSIEEIRQPSGLGERADSMLSAGSVGTFGSVHEAVVVDMRKDLRHQSFSQPNLLFLANQPPSFRIASSSVGSASTFEHDSKPLPNEPTPKFIHAGFPPELIYAVCGFLSRADLLSVACTSTLFLADTRKLLYENIDLREVIPDRVDKCLDILASRQDLAALVRTFSCSNLPSFSENDSPLPYLSFSIALHNMHSLKSLSLPRFDTHLLHYTSFRLERATFTCEVMSETEQKQFSTWLSNQGDLVSLCLPALTTEIQIMTLLQSPKCRTEDLNLGKLSFPAPPTQHLVVPKLTHFDGPTSLVVTLVPGRPVTNVVIHVRKTLYDGLKPSALMASLAKSTSPITKLSIVPSSQVDARTLERLLMSAGADLGLSVQTLEVDWMLDVDILYKNLVSVIARFKKLQMLHLHKRFPPIPSISVPPSPLPSSPSSFYSAMSPSPSVSTFLSPPQSPYAKKNGSYSTLPSPLMSEAESVTSSTEPDNRKSVEHRYLKSWAKSCSTLRTAIFLSGAEWCVMKRRKRLSIIGIRDTGLGFEEAESRTVNVLSFVRWRLEI